MTHLEFDCSDEKAVALIQASRLYDEGVMPAEWISVKDRMPDEFKRVLVSVRHKHNPKDGYREVEIRHWSTSYGWYMQDSYYDITHWMPLPEPPKEEW